jgi:hypothetical protein
VEGFAYLIDGLRLRLTRSPMHILNITLIGRIILWHIAGLR